MSRIISQPPNGRDTYIKKTRLSYISQLRQNGLENNLEIIPNSKILKIALEIKANIKRCSEIISRVIGLTRKLLKKYVFLLLLY
jgi:hypothetical protein